MTVNQENINNVSSSKSTQPAPDRLQSSIHIRVLSPHTIDQKTIDAWVDLEQRTLDPNAYLSPYFVLPAAKYLDPTTSIRIVLIEHQQLGNQKLIGLGIFRDASPNRYFPLPHQEAYRSTHSFSSGVLIDRDHAKAAIHGLFNYFRRRESGWHGITFTECSAESPLFYALSEAAATCDLKWFQFDSAPRAIMVPAEAGQAYLDRKVTGRAKDARRRFRMLQKLGAVHWRIIDNSSSNFYPSVERFLELEHLGWKGKNGSSLHARDGHAHFFREMAMGFLHDGRAFFTELTLNDVVISSTFNMTSGKAGFAFKIGWDPEFSKMSPGLLNELELIRQAPDHFQHLDYIDSGAPPGSYMEDIWLSRQAFVSGAFTTTHIAEKLLTSISYLRKCKQQWRKLMVRANIIVSLAISTTCQSCDGLTALFS